jgi:2-C-methyl-D-erythritol 4-phosphate cytidylyltransferase
MSYAVIIPAAGSGSRMGASVPKVLLPLHPLPEGHVEEQSIEARSILQRSVGMFARDPRCSVVAVCVPAPWRERFEQDLEEYQNVAVVNGGATRQESVHNGAEYLSARLPEDTCVLVHDAARCCVSLEVIDRVVSGVREYGAVTAAVRIVDSLCRAQSQTVGQYVDRENLWAIQTPQGFALHDLTEAHRTAAKEGIAALDDAGLVGRIRPVYLVDGERFNIKVTEPGDLPTAIRILGAERAAGNGAGA